MNLAELEPSILTAGALTAAFALGLALERLAPHERWAPSWRVNLSLGALGSAINAIVCGSCGWVVAHWVSVAHVGLLQWTEAASWLAIPLAVVGLDAVSYAWHRANHELRLFWRFHRVHHTDRAFHVSTALRFHPVELLLSVPVRLIAIVALGAPPLAVVSFEIVFAIANVLEHGDFDLPRWLERRVSLLLITPALHRLHHSREREERDSNFGTIFSVWDRLAATHAPSNSALHFATGLPDAAGGRDRSLLASLTEPFQPVSLRR